MAVLGAAAGLDRHDALDLDLRAAPAQPHLVGEREQVGQRVVGQLEDRRAPATRRGPGRSSSTCCAGDVEDVDRVEGGLSLRWRGHAGSLPHRRRRPAPGPSPSRAASRNSWAGRSPAPARSAPDSGRAASISRSRTLLRQARSGPLRPGADHQPGEGDSPRWAIASSVSAVWLRVPRDGLRHDQHRRRQVPGQVRDRRAVLVVPHEQPTRALDEHQAAVLARARAPVARSRAGRRRRARSGGPRRRGTAGPGSGRARAGR